MEEKIMRLARKYIITAFVAAFALTFALATPYVMAEMGEKKHGDMIEKMNAYCDMSPEEQAEAIAKHHKSDEMVAKMNEYCSLDEEGQKAMIAEYKEKFKEIKQAFASISEEDHATIMSHFKDMKEQHADLTEEEKTAKHAEFKQQMEAFMSLSLDEKISYLEYLAMSLRNQA